MTRFVACLNVTLLSGFDTQSPPPVAGANVIVWLTVLPMKRPAVILPLNEALNGLPFCCASVTEAVDVFIVFQVNVRFPLSALPVPPSSVWQFPGLENLILPLTLAEVTPPPVHFVSLPVAAIVDSTLLEPVGSGGVNVAVPLVVVHVGVAGVEAPAVEPKARNGTASAATLATVRMVLRIGVVPFVWVCGGTPHEARRPSSPVRGRIMARPCGRVAAVSRLFQRSGVGRPLMFLTGHLRSHQGMRWKNLLPIGTALGLAVALAAPVATPASAATKSRASGAGITVDYNLTATTHIKKLNQDVTIKNGDMLATVDLNTGNLTGHLTLPPATTTITEAGVGVLTATFQMKEAKPISGHINFATLHVTATSVFNILVKSAYLGPIPINLVGNNCTTASPVSVTMSGKASFTGPSTFTGTYTIPQFKNCSLSTTVLNQLIPGPGNTFKAVAKPKA